VTVLIWALLGILLVFALYLFLLTPRHRRPEAEPLMKTAYAHRGLWDAKNPENSLAAFRAAVENGFGIELDVQLTKDGELVVFHDVSLSRMTGCDGFVYEKTYEELCALTLGKSNERIPTFREVLALVDGRVPLLVEIKSDHAWRSVAESAASLLDGYEGAYTVESFHPLVVAWF
jgi:glycerophosphoryl diester phosphodiesterase